MAVICFIMMEKSWRSRFLGGDYGNLCVLPIEIKSGKEGYSYRAMPKLVETENYRIQKRIILSNNSETKVDDSVN